MSEKTLLSTYHKYDTSLLVRSTSYFRVPCCQYSVFLHAETTIGKLISWQFFYIGRMISVGFTIKFGVYKVKQRTELQLNQLK